MMAPARTLPSSDCIVTGDSAWLEIRYTDARGNLREAYVVRVSHEAMPAVLLQMTNALTELRCDK